MRALRVQTARKIISNKNRFGIILIIMFVLLLSDLIDMDNNKVSLIDVKELSQRLSVSKFTIYCWVSQGKIPHVKICGRLVRFDPREVETWINEQRVKPNEVWAR